MKHWIFLMTGRTVPNRFKQTIFQNAALFDGASTQVVRRHFKAWRARAFDEEQGSNAKIEAWRAGESLRRTRDAEARDRAAWVERERDIALRESAIAEGVRLAAEKAERRAARKRRAQRRADTDGGAW